MRFDRREKSSIKRFFLLCIKYHQILSDPKIYSQPVLQIFETDSYNLDTNFKKIHNYFYSYNNLITDLNLINFDTNPEEISFLEYWKNTENIVRKQTADILEIPIYLSKIKFSTNRSYTKLKNVFSTVGGVVIFFQFILNQIYYFLIQFNLKYYLYHKSYKFMVKDPIKKNQLKKS
jgi:hypothetical protein